MSKLFKISFASILLIATSYTATAQVIVNGNGAARDCYMSAKLGNIGTISAIKKCETALSDTLSIKDIVATHTNIGVLLMRKGDYAEAQSHYERAINIKPKTAETYINYGASLIHSGDFQKAISVINTAIDLETEKMPEALFNRAMAYDRLKNYKGAYKDLKQALILKPEWPAAQRAIQNYNVTTRSTAN